VDVLVLIGSFTVVCLMGLPVAYALGIAAILAALWVDIPLEAVMLKVSGGMSGFSLLAIPFFILAGAIMAVGGMAERLVNLAKVFVGFIRGHGAREYSCVHNVRLHLRLIGCRHGRGGLGDDPADDQERLSAPVCRECHNFRIASAAARSAIPQHDHLLDRGGRDDIGRAPVHGRNYSGTPARSVSHHSRAYHRIPEQLPEGRGRTAP